MMSRLVSARWLANHGVMLRYAGAGPRTRFVRPDQALTVGEAARLMRRPMMWFYRLEARGKIRFRDRRGVATVGLAEIRRLNGQTGS